MIETDALLAAINDNYTLNNKKVINLLVDILRDTGGSLSPSEALGHLRKLERSDDPRGDHAEELLTALESTDFTEYTRYLRRIESSGVEFSHLFESGYPACLWRLHDQPIALYKQGPISLANSNVAIVGTRSATESRKEDTHALAARLAEEEYTIVSGLALGVDAAAHRGALSVGGRTIAIQPADIESIYPKSNADLGEKIRNKGALVSEISKFATMHNGRYVERNRITSGISDALVVTASGETGGTVRQSEIAQKQGIPRFLYDPEDGSSQSPKKLLDLGFKKFSDVDELLDLLASSENIFDPTSTKRRTLDEF